MSDRKSDPINPPHYKMHPAGIEAIDIIEHMPFNIGTAIKYLWRCGHKGDAIEDLRKSRWYIDREIHRLESMRGPQANRADDVVPAGKPSVRDIAAERERVDRQAKEDLRRELEILKAEIEKRRAAGREQRPDNEAAGGPILPEKTKWIRPENSAYLPGAIAAEADYKRELDSMREEIAKRRMAEGIERQRQAAVDASRVISSTDRNDDAPPATIRDEEHPYIVH